MCVKEEPAVVVHEVLVVAMEMREVGGVCSCLCGGTGFSDVIDK